MPEEDQQDFFALGTLLKFFHGEPEASSDTPVLQDLNLSTNCKLFSDSYS
jgi:hypothetical protein